MKDNSRKTTMKNFKNISTTKRNNRGLFFQLSFFALFAMLTVFSGQTLATDCTPSTPSTTVTEGNLFPGGIVSFGVTSAPRSVIVDHVNAGTGLQSLTVVGTPTNATVNIPAFTPGTFAAVTVTFSVPNTSQAVDFTLRAASTFHALNIRVRCSAPPTPTPTPTPMPTPTPAPCVPGELILTGDSALDGPDGNIRTFNAGNLSVKASGFSRRNDNGQFETAYLGAYGSGLGVTDRGEGNGDNNRHVVDNIGDRKNYVLFEFNRRVVVDKAFLDSIGADSDITVYVGNTNDPYNNHITLTDALLASFGSEENTTGNNQPRNADINNIQEVGNVLVIAAAVNETTPEDEFKIKNLSVMCPQVPSILDEPVQDNGLISLARRQTQ